MPNLTPKNQLDIEQELANLTLYKYHPNGILNVSLNRLTDMLDGRVEIVDPANPFVYLLETSALNTAFAIQEYTLLTRKLYPRLANSEEDLYLHMSDVDYLGRFSEPAVGVVNFNVLLNDIKSKGKYYPERKEHLLTIPKHFRVGIDKFIFTLMSSISIRITETGVIDIKYGEQEESPLFPITTNHIDFKLATVNQSETYIGFSVSLPELDVEVTDLPVEKSKLFKNTVTYHPERNFYYFRAFHLFEGEWREMLVTHTEQVYDIYTPTCVVKVDQTHHQLEYYIPPVYVNTGRIGTRVKLLTYTTLGPIDVNFGDYQIGDFVTEYNAVFPELELDDSTTALNLVTKAVYLKDRIVDGKGPISFTELKDAVIDNSIGDRKLPITHKQLDYAGQQENFSVIRNVDNVTNRIFLLECPIPSSPTRYSVSRINMDMMEYKTTIQHLITGKNGVIAANDYVTVIPEGTIFEVDSDGLRLLTIAEAEALRSKSDIDLATTVNQHRYLSLYYHYVLDTLGDTTVLRAYDINRPEIANIGFKNFNSSAEVGINSSDVNIYKSVGGFTLDILANLKQYTDLISEINVLPYLIYKDENSNLFYLEGRLYTHVGENPVYRFDILSDYYIDSDHHLVINNFKDTNGNYIQVDVDLLAKLELIYVSDVVPAKFEASAMDSYLYGSYLSIGRVAVTLENLDIRFGYWLEYLYSRVHTSTALTEYQTYEEDVPARHTHTVYAADNSILHHVNDIVYDEDSNIVYAYRKGDLVLDSNGNPLPICDADLDRYLNLLLIDYRATLVERPEIKSYKQYLRSYLTEKIVDNAASFQDQLLENTTGYVVVPKNLDNVQVIYSGKVGIINAAQSFKVSVYVTGRIYNDASARKDIENAIVTLVERYLAQNTTLSKTALLNTLYTELKEFISGISIDSFTELNSEYIEIVNKSDRISINKVLVVEPDGYNLRDDIQISFNMVGN